MLNNWERTGSITSYLQLGNLDRVIIKYLSICEISTQVNLMSKRSTYPVILYFLENLSSVHSIGLYFKRDDTLSFYIHGQVLMFASVYTPCSNTFWAACRPRALADKGTRQNNH